MQNEVRAFSTLEDGLSYIEHHYRLDVDALTILINNMIKMLPEEPSEQWMFTTVFITEGLVKLGLFVRDGLDKLFDAFDMPDGAPQYTKFAEKLAGIFQSGITDNTEYDKIFRLAMQWSKKKPDNVPLTKSAKWVRSH